MNCRQARDLFSSRVDNELTSEEGGRLQAHLEACPACASKWRSFAVTVQMVRDLPEVAPDANFVGQVLDRVRAYEAGRHQPIEVEGRRLLERVRDLLESVSAVRILAPMRFAGAAALGLLAGVMVAQYSFHPVDGSGGINQAVAVHSTATPSVSGPVSTSSVAASRFGERPFGDLVDQIPADGVVSSPSDSVAPASRPAGTYLLEDPQASGRQVGLTGANGRPQITF